MSEKEVVGPQEKGRGDLTRLAVPGGWLYERDYTYAESDPAHPVSGWAVFVPEPSRFDIVFDGPPGPEAGRFVEVERDGKSISVGKWLKREDGLWILRIGGDPA